MVIHGGLAAFGVIVDVSFYYSIVQYVCMLLYVFQKKSFRPTQEGSELV